MATDIDELRIQIEAESEQADSALDDLISKIDNLAQSLSSINGKKATGEIEDFKGQAQKATQAVQSIVGKYQDLGKGFKLKGSVDYIQKQIDSLSNSLSKASLKKQELEVSDKTGGKMYEYAVRDTIKFGNMIESLKEQLEELSETKISPQFEEAVRREEEKIEKAYESKSEMPKLVKVAEGSMGYDQSVIDWIDNYSTKAEKAVKSLGESLKKLVVPEIKEENLKKLESALNSSEQKLEKLRTKLANGLTMGAIKESAEDKGFVRLQTEIALTEKEVDALKEKIAEVKKNSSGNGFDKFKKFLSSIGSAAKTAFTRISNLAKGMATLSHRIKKSNASLNGGIKSILKYGLGIRSLYVLFNKLRSGIKEGMKNLVQFSSETNSSVSLLNNSFTQLKNASASMVAPLLNALAPALNTIIQWCVKATNAVNQLIAALTGKSTWVKAKKLTDDYASSLDNASASASKLKSTTHGIDELNINSKDDSSGSSGGTSASDMFEYEDISAKWGNIAEWIKSMWEEADFTELGEVIGNKLTNTLGSIKWETIYSGAKDFGKSFATFLNGLISPELFGKVGSTIASSLNTAIYAAMSFGQNFDFYDFGVSIATGINNFFDTFDFGALAETLNTWVDGLKDTISGFLDTITWSEILEATTTFLGTLELDTVEVLIGAFVLKNSTTNLLELLASAVLGKFTFSVTMPEILLSISSFSLGNMSGASFQVIGAQIVEWIEQAMESLLPESFANAIGGALAGAAVGGVAGSWFSGVGTLVGAIVGAIVGALGNIEIDGSSILHMLLDPIFNWDATKDVWESAKENFQKGGINIVLGIAEGILSALGLIVEPIGDLFVFIFETICSVFGIHSPATTMTPIGEYIVLGLLEGITEKLKNIGKWIEEHIFQPFIDGFKEAFGIHSPSTVMEEQGGFIVSGMLEGLKGKIVDVWEWIKGIPGEFTSFFNDLPSEMKGIGGNVISGLWDGMTDIWDSVSEWLSSVAGKISGIFSQVLDIHSPSRVMFEIGSYTIEGLKNGMEALYDPTIKSLGDFSYDIQTAPLVNNFSYPTQTVYSANNYSGELASSLKQAVKEVVSEMLEPYLSDIAETNRTVASKELSVAIGDREIYKASIRGSKSYGKLLVT